MTIASVRELIEQDHWTGVAGQVPERHYLLRYREPVLQPLEVAEYPRCLRVVWAYDAVGSGTLPDERVSGDMRTFEDRLSASLEHDAVAVLTAVLTFDGARQWVFYTDDVQACGARLNSMPQESEPYPIELDVFDDPAWQYLRGQILKDRGEPAT
jgi:hypothetical protein